MPAARADRPDLPSWRVSNPYGGVRLDKFLAAPERLGSRSRVIDALAKGKVFVNGSEAAVADAGSRVRPGDVVSVWMDRPGSTRRRRPRIEGSGIDIVYEDEVLAVVNKPAGLLTVPLASRRDADSVVDRLKTYLRPSGRGRLQIVHRIDRDTSGLVLFAKNTRAQVHLKEQFRRRTPERVYLAIVHGHPQPPSGTWCDDLVWDQNALLQRRAHPKDPRKKEAVTHYRVIETLPSASLLELRLETGKRNQIRIQARLHGHMLVGERLYVKTPDSSRPIVFPRQALHAQRLSFSHPVDGRLLTFEAPLPRDMKALLSRLRHESSHNSQNHRSHL